MQHVLSGSLVVQIQRPNCFWLGPEHSHVLRHAKRGSTRWTAVVERGLERTFGAHLVWVGRLSDLRLRQNLAALIRVQTLNRVRHCPSQIGYLLVFLILRNRLATVNSTI